MTTVKNIKENNIFIRSGSCNRCGKCCYAYNKHPLDGGKKIPCKNLSYNNKGIAICEIHGVNKHQICKDNPIYPTACMVPEAVDTCGYSWVVNNKLTKIEALEKFNNLCNLCHKFPCFYYDKFINNINEM